jgi:hypothetical protein
MTRLRDIYGPGFTQAEYLHALHAGYETGWWDDTAYADFTIEPEGARGARVDVAVKSPSQEEETRYQSFQHSSTGQSWWKDHESRLDRSANSCRAPTGRAFNPHRTRRASRSQPLALPPPAAHPGTLRRDQRLPRPPRRQHSGPDFRTQRLFGVPDYLLRVITADLPAFQELYDERLATLRGVQRLTSTLVMKSVVENRPCLCNQN